MSNQSISLGQKYNMGTMTLCSETRAKLLINVRHTCSWTVHAHTVYGW